MSRNTHIRHVEEQSGAMGNRESRADGANVRETGMERASI
jgi:hypothetical protein